MNYLKDFIIPFKGLSLGDHKYNWVIDNKFFEQFENDEIEACKINIDLVLDKQERMMILAFTISGKLSFKCDRCLDELKYQINKEETVYVKFGEERDSDSESEDVIVLSDLDYQVDVSALLNDYLILSFPMQRVHKNENDCNKDMLNRIGEHVKNDSIDPRWEKLKNIKLD